MTATATVTIAAGQTAGALPADYLEGRSVSGGGYDWTQVAPEKLRQNSDWSTDAYSYSVFGGNINIPTATTAATVLTLVYFQRLPAVTASVGNWVLTNHASCYLWLCLVESSNYSRDTEALTMYEQRAGAALEALRLSDQAASFFAAEMPGYQV